MRNEIQVMEGASYVQLLYTKVALCQVGSLSFHPYAQYTVEWNNIPNKNRNTSRHLRQLTLEWIKYYQNQETSLIPGEIAYVTSWWSSWCLGSRWCPQWCEHGGSWCSAWSPLRSHSCSVESDHVVPSWSPQTSLLCCPHSGCWICISPLVIVCEHVRSFVM